MKKQFLSLFSSVLISMTLVTGSTFATDEAISTLTVTESQPTSQSHGTESPDSQESNYQQPSNESHDSNTSNHEEQNNGHDDSNNHNEHNDDSNNHNEHNDDSNNHDDDDDSNNHDDDDDDDSDNHDDNLGTGSCGTGTVTTGNNNTGSLDLWIRKGSYINGTTTGNIGDTINYIITYGNGGSIVATGVTISDVFPLLLASTQGFTGRTQSGDTFTYNLGTLNPGASGQILFTGVVLSGTVSGLQITNTANITSSTFEDTILLGNNTSSTTVTTFATGTNGTGGNGTGTTGGIADVFVIKTASIASGNVGNQIVYTLTYGNTGNAIATGVKLTDEFPAAVSGNLAGWTNLTGNIWQMTLPDMAAGFVGSVSITGTLAVGATYGMNIINLAEIATASHETNTVNNSSFAQTRSYAKTDECDCKGNNSLKGVVYVDSMRNNIYNVGSDGVLSGVIVNLYTNGTLTNTTLTDSNGAYVFGLLPDNTYDVGYVMPAGSYLAVVSNVGDKGGVSTSVMKLSSIVLTGGVVSAVNNFGLITQGGGSSGGGGGGFAGGISTVPTTPTKPTPTKDPLVPIAPSIDTPDELLDTGPEILPQELLASGPDIAIENLSEQGTFASKARSILHTSNAFIQNIPTTVETLSVRPIQYVNVLLGYEGALSTLIRNILLAFLGSILLTVLVYGATSKSVHI